MGKCPELKARVHIEFKDDPVLYEELLRMIMLAIEISDMDEEEALNYQETFLNNL